MRLFTSALCSVVAIGLISGCAGNMSPSSSALPGAGQQFRTGFTPVNVMGVPTRAEQVLHSILQPDVMRNASSGLYVSEFDASDVYGYPAANKGNKGPTCMVPNVSYVNGIGVDGAGNLMAPDGGASYLLLYKGPGMCGKSFGEIADTYGQPSDAASTNAATGKIALANIFDTGKTPGSLSICTNKGGCTTNLTNSKIYEAGGVAMSTKGDCWLSASGVESGGTSPSLMYFKGCAGKGAAATGFKNTGYGNLDIDSKGNIVSTDSVAETIYVYSGCATACKVVSGPFKMHGQSFFGKLNSTSTAYAMADIANGAVDVYTYSPTKIKYSYSFTKGLAASLVPIGTAYNPRSKE
ncbi:MAG TPA: hypothetical protein VKR56_06265 [Candidatus Cybelea sp.]|nr:hypothetical protein [Candidatus Cybelea sp.]